MLRDMAYLILGPEIYMDKPFKRFEREVAALIGGKRYPANSGHEVDCEGPTIVAQCKLVSRLSLEELTTLAETARSEGIARGKAGLVAVKVRRGKGHPSPALVVMTADMLGVLGALTQVRP